MEEITRQRPDLQDALSLIENVKPVASPSLEGSNLEFDKARIELLIREKDEIIRMRRMWSITILVAIIGITVFDIIVITLLGIGLMRFSEGYIVPAFIAESLLKTLGLAAIVVNFLFDHKSLR